MDAAVAIGSNIPAPTIVIMTSRFPFDGGEQFLETEVKYWAQEWYTVVLLPAAGSGKQREVPAGMLVDSTLVRMRTPIRKGLYLVRVIATKLFWQEVVSLISLRRFSLRQLYVSARCLSQAYIAASALRDVSRRRGPISLIYSYWNDCESYGAILVKRKRLVKQVIARSHGYDMFEETRLSGHMPLKRLFAAEFDAVYPNSDHGERYMKSTYSFPQERLVSSRLAVVIPSSVAKPSPPLSYHIVSVSFCEPVKRIDKMIDAIAMAANSMPDVSLHWTHVGGGSLYDSLQQYASKELFDVHNVTYSFAGTVDNRALWPWLTSQPVDVFLNASSSEGLGVAIMEAMSWGVPAIAPDVGGVSELVNQGRGFLMSATPGIAEISAHLVVGYVEAKKSLLRQAAREFSTAGCDAEEIYPDFVANCLERLTETA